MNYEKRFHSWHSILIEIGRSPLSKVPKESGWSAREILGHLVDSAAINLLRFKSVLILNKSEFTGYNQSEFVSRNNYDSRNYGDILHLWLSINTALVKLANSLSPNQLSTPLSAETFQKIAFVQPSKKSEENLEFLIYDYFEHLDHHVKQITEL